MTESNENILESIWYKFFPFWPLFLLLTGLFLAIGIAFTLYQKPSFVTTASLVITNENNTNRNSSNQPFQALNPFATTQVVDNEVLILQSRSLMKDVVKTLHLYAPVWEKRSVSAYSAWATSPIIVEAQQPESLKKVQAVYFTFDAVSQTVKIGQKHHALNQWYRFPYGTIRFVRNPHQNQNTHRALYFNIDHPTIMAEQLTGNLKVASVSKLSTTINLTYQTDVPELGETIVNELLRQYLRSSIEHENALASNTLTFVNTRLRDVERELDSIERRIQEFRTRTGAIDLGEQSRIYLQNVAETDRRISEIDAQLALLGQVSRYVNSEGLRSGVVPTNLGIDDPVLAELLNQLNKLELELADQRTTTGANNPVVRSLENEIQKIRPNIQNIVRNQQSRLQASRNNLAGTSGRIGSTIRGIPGQERELLEISRQQAVKRDLYAFLLQRREEADLSNSSAIVNNRIVDWADANVATRKSSRIIVLAACLIVGLALAFIYVLIRENLSRNVLFRSEVESYTRYPVAGEVTYHRQRKNSRTTSISNTLLAREFNQLQAALGLFQEDATKKTLLVTSSLMGEGASFVSRNLAIHLAAAGKKVALLDLNALKPDTSRAFDQQDAPGLSAYFAGNSSASVPLQRTSYTGLDLLSPGNQTNLVSLLLHPRMNDLMADLKSRYDFIVLDMPPLELSADAYAMSRFADATLLVIRHGNTPRNLLKKLDENIELQHLKDVRIVLNGVKARGFPRRYFGYGFGYGHELVPKKQLLKLSKSA